MRVEVHGTGLQVQDVGSGPPVVLLHGWPDTHRVWRHQVAALTSAGYRCIVPDLRGFGGSDKPSAVEAYAVPVLAGDVLGVLEHLGIERSHVIGHDWGAALAWALAAFAPERVDHLAVLSVGHPGAFREAGLPQREKSWYMLLFQFPGVAERWLSADDFANIRGGWLDHPDGDAVAADLARVGALTASLNWYRANVPPESLLATGSRVPQVAAPTMGVWSSGDVALLEAQMTGSVRYVSGRWRYERIDGAGHWLQLQRPDEVNRLLLDFLPTP